MIRTKNITKSFGDLQVLKGIELEINSGEIISIVGASGAGKTTLLQIIGTLLQKDRERSGLIMRTLIHSVKNNWQGSGT